jgi:hypothetical protein
MHAESCSAVQACTWMPSREAVSRSLGSFAHILGQASRMLCHVTLACLEFAAATVVAGHGNLRTVAVGLDEVTQVRQRRLELLLVTRPETPAAQSLGSARAAHVIPEVRGLRGRSTGKLRAKITYRHRDELLSH